MIVPFQVRSVFSEAEDYFELLPLKSEVNEEVYTNIMFLFQRHAFVIQKQKNLADLIINIVYYDSGVNMDFNSTTIVSEMAGSSNTISRSPEMKILYMFMSSFGIPGNIMAIFVLASSKALRYVIKHINLY